MIQVDIKGQKAKVRTPFIAGDTIKYLEASFTFQGEKWKEASKIAVFQDAKGKAYTRILKDDKITSQDNLDLTEGQWLVGVVGTLQDGTRITTDAVPFVVSKAVRTDGEVLPPIEPTLAEQILAKAENAERIAQSVRDDADAGLFKGEKGDKGEQGIQGIQGEQGESGVYVGEDPVPKGTKVQVIPTGEVVEIPEVFQETGTSTEDTMSQKVITDELDKKADKEGKWELIDTITLEQEQKLEYFCNLSAVKLDVTTTVSNKIPIWFGGINAITGRINGIGSMVIHDCYDIKCFTTGTVCPKRGIWDVLFTPSIDIKSSQVKPLINGVIYPYRNRNIKNVPKITKIFTLENMPVGTILEIWGVR